MEKIRVTVWNEYAHERASEVIAKVYPCGIHGAIAEGLRKNPNFDVKCATLDMEECGLDEETLNNTDVLIWWGHIKHADVPDAVAERVQRRVLDGMGLRVVTIGENGVTEDDILVHDAHSENVGIHMMLADMKYPEFPVALGIIRDVKDVTYDDGVRDQVAEVKAKSKIQCVDDLLRSGSTWEVK